MPNTDFAIIGAGIQGASLAYHLQKSGAGRVTLFERDHPASGATGYSAALVRMYYDNEVEARLAFAGYSFFANWADVIGGDCGFRPIGVLWMKGTDKADELRAGIAMQQRIGVNTSFITPDQIKEQFPYVNVDGIAGGAFEPESGFADPAATATSMVEAAKALGCDVRLSSRVTSLTREGDRITGFVMNGEQWTAGLTIVAAGSWTAKLCETAGIFVPLRPHRLPAGFIHRPSDLPAHTVMVDESLPMWFRPDLGDRTMLGAEFEPNPYGYDPDEFWPPANPESLVVSASIAAKRVPAYERATLGRSWCGIDGFTPDGQQIIGAVPGVEGLQLLCGGNGHGFKVGPAIGKALAEMITTGSTQITDMSQFDYARFGGQTEFDSWPGEDGMNLGSHVREIRPTSQ